MSQSRTSRLAYVLVWFITGFCLGVYGIHNFVAGYTARGLIQLLFSMLSWVCFLAAIPTAGLTLICTVPLWLVLFIWTLIEICTVKVDAQGRSMI